MKGKRVLTGVVVAVLAALVGWWMGSAGADRPADQPAGEPAASATVTVSETERASPENGPIDPDSGLPWVAADDLRQEARNTLKLIESDGPFPYDRDGATFENRERILPDRSRGYYREYTVETPGSDDRGARRIVAGAGGERYYTDDHYDSFRRVAQSGSTSEDRPVRIAE